MMTLRTIEIDFDIHQMIELERKGFDEPEYLALRRLLKLPPPKTCTKTVSQNETLSGRSWFGKGVELPHQTELRMSYNGKEFRGYIDNGEWVVDGHRAKSPSDAAACVAVTKSGSRPSLNGWVYWEVKRPTDANWKELRALRSNS